MGWTVSAEEAKSRTGYGLVQEPAPDVSEEVLKIEPLPQFSVSIPTGWKDALYNEQH